VCYKGSWASYQIAKRIITLKYISLVNLIMDEEVVTELIQEDFNTKKIKIELQRILELTIVPNYCKVRNIRKNWVVLEPVNKQLN
jgi:lipid-A-disaccharide synthase